MPSHDGWRARKPKHNNGASLLASAVPAGLVPASIMFAAGILVLILAPSALAQHATAFDIEDGGRAYQNVCANCHGPDGDLILGIDLGRGMFRRPLSDEELVDIIVNGIPDTPMPPTPGVSEEQALRIVAYLRALAEDGERVAAEGDPERGRGIFDGKGGCLDCHRVGTEGSRLGPSLTRIGLVRRAAELERSLLDPRAEVQPENRFYTVTLPDGQSLTGRLLNHDTFTVQLMGPDERLHSFNKAELLEHGFADTPMPSFRGELDATEIADVVSYLVTLRGEAGP